MQTISASIDRATAAGQQPSAAYTDVGSPGFTVRWNVMSGGGSVVSGYVPFGRYIELAEINWDHFSYGGRAWAAYTAGHSAALQQAMLAHTLAGQNATMEHIESSLQAAYTREVRAHCENSVV